MFWSSLLLASALPLVLGADDDGFIWCGESTQNVPVCLTRVPDNCFNCLHPVEIACGNASKDQDAYDTCLCTIPGNTWTGIKKCLTEAGNGCADSQKMIFNGYGVECGTSHLRDQFHNTVCNADNQKNDALLKALGDEVCDGTLTGTVTLGPTKTAAVSTNTVIATTNSNTAPTASNTVPSSTNSVQSVTGKPTGTASQPTTTSGAVVTAGAAGLVFGGVNMAAALVAGAVINGF